MYFTLFVISVIPVAFHAAILHLRLQPGGRSITPRNRGFWELWNHAGFRGCGAGGSRRIFSPSVLRVMGGFYNRSCNWVLFQAGYNPTDGMGLGLARMGCWEGFFLALVLLGNGVFFLGRWLLPRVRAAAAGVDFLI